MIARQRRRSGTQYLASAQGLSLFATADTGGGNMPPTRPAMNQSQLVRLVQMLKDYSYPLESCKSRWPEFLQLKGMQGRPVRDGDLHGEPAPDAKGTKSEALREFVMSLIEPDIIPTRRQPGGAPAAATEAPDYSRNQTLVARFMRWLVRVDKEVRMRATSAPPPAPIPRKARAAHAAAAAPATPTSPPAGAPPTQPPQQPTATERIVDAWDLVHATRAHAAYSRTYKFPSHQPGWARTKRRVITASAPSHSAGGSSGQPAGQPNGSSGVQGSRQPRLVALDCEMVATADGDLSSLVNLSVVDEMGKVLYTSKVKPRHAVVDYRTHITGLTPADLEGVTTTRSDARRAVKALLLEGWRLHGVPTILVGHGLHNDLQALRLDHQPCIDTSYIFSYQNLPECTPSLRDLHRIVLGGDMVARGAGRHDSAEDAGAAMRLVRHELGRQGRTQALPAPDVKAPRDELRMLLVHSIPAAVTEQRLLALFTPMLAGARSPAAPHQGSSTATGPAAAAAVDKESDDDDSDEDDEDEEGRAARVEDLREVQERVQVSMTSGPVITQVPTFDSQPAIRNSRAKLVFKHAGEANAAFSALPGKLEKDSTGLPTKHLVLGGGLVVKIRKSAGHNGFVFAQGEVRRPGEAPRRADGGKRQGQARPQVGGLVVRQPHGTGSKYVKPPAAVAAAAATAAEQRGKGPNGKRQRLPDDLVVRQPYGTGSKYVKPAVAGVEQAPRSKRQRVQHDKL